MARHDNLLNELHELQDQSGQNWLPPADLDRVGAKHRMLRAEIRGVASYYSMLSLSPRGETVIRICESPVCRLRGAEELIAASVAAAAENAATARPADAAALRFSVERCQCLGHCAESPVMMVGNQVLTGVTPRRARELIAAGGAAAQAAGAAVENAKDVAREVGGRTGHAAAPAPATQIALRYAGTTDPTSLESYLSAGGYGALRTALHRASDAVVAELAQAGLRGRGGAGFPTGTKGQSTAQSCTDSEQCDRFVVVNADEGEPGTFKDRIIMEEEPHLLLEGLIISAFGIGAAMGFIYIRGEYTAAIARLETAIAQARAAGFLGANILGSGFDFEVYLRRGAGSYLCGEELTLLESLEGKRGYPRIKPPFPAEKGLWGKPTLVNNVETLANVPWIIEHGADAYLQLGVSGSPGTKIFCISGDVVRPGFVEVELGLTLRSLIDDHAGGVLGGGNPVAVLIGGAAGTFAAVSRLDLPLDYDGLRREGLTLGSGAVIVLGPRRDPADTIAAILSFFRHESCGKCVPCRVGTARLEQAGQRLRSLPRGTRLPLLDEMVHEADLMARTSVCPLGQSPILALRSAARELREVL